MDGADRLRPPLAGLAYSLRLAVVAALLSLLPFVAWTVRNWHTFHVFQPLAPRYANDPGEFAAPGFVRWVKTLTADFTSTSEIYWNGNSDRIDPGNLPARAIDNAAQYQETQRLLQDYNATTTLTPELDARFAQLAQQRIRAHPFRYYVTLPLLRLADMWLRPRVETLNTQLRWWQYAQHPRETCVAIFYGVLNLAYLVAGFSGDPSLAEDGGRHGGADPPAQPVAGYARGARITLYPGMFSAAVRLRSLLFHHPRGAGRQL